MQMKEFKETPSVFANPTAWFLNDGGRRRGKAFASVLDITPLPAVKKLCQAVYAAATDCVSRTGEA
jgi:hypothetical protein